MPLQDPIITNKDGYFQSSSDGPTAQTLRIIATDIDGDINGSYANDTIEGDNPSVSYATVYPVCMFLRVIVIQITLMLFI